MTLDATGQAELVRRGEASPPELVDAAIARIERLNPDVNAVVVPLFDDARRRAASDDFAGKAFGGVPFLYKDLGACEEGMPVYSGNRVLRELDRRARADVSPGDRFRAAGFVSLGKTNTPEFGVQPTTQPHSFGPTRNPWDLALSVSGSSGGSAAAVASGMVAAAHANDGGGSIRMPAAWCGVVGLKPSRGRVPRGVYISRLGQEHVVTRSVRDTAAILDAICGPEPGDLHIAPPPIRPFAEEVGQPPGRLRIGLLTSVDSEAARVDAECVAAAEGAGRLLESLGHDVEQAGPGRLYNDVFWERAEVDYACYMYATVATLWEILGRELRSEDFEPYTWARLERQQGATAYQHIRAASWLQGYARRICSWWGSGFDVLVTPTTGVLPQPLEELMPDPADPFAIDQDRFASIRCFARPFNVTGQPAISLPLHWTAGGLPVGVQLVADLGREDVLIRLASQLEEARPWAGRHPPVA